MNIMAISQLAACVAGIVVSCGSAIYNTWNNNRMTQQESTPYISPFAMPAGYVDGTINPTTTPPPFYNNNGYTSTPSIYDGSKLHRIDDYNPYQHNTNVETRRNDCSYQQPMYREAMIHQYHNQPIAFQAPMMGQYVERPYNYQYAPSYSAYQSMGNNNYTNTNAYYSNTPNYYQQPQQYCNTNQVNNVNTGNTIYPTINSGNFYNNANYKQFQQQPQYQQQSPCYQYQNTNMNNRTIYSNNTDYGNFNQMNNSNYQYQQQPSYYQYQQPQYQQQSPYYQYQQPQTQNYESSSAQTYGKVTQNPQTQQSSYYQYQQPQQYQPKNTESGGLVNDFAIDDLYKRLGFESGPVSKFMKTPDLASTKDITATTNATPISTVNLEQSNVGRPFTTAVEPPKTNNVQGANQPVDDFCGFYTDDGQPLYG